MIHYDAEFRETIERVLEVLGHKSDIDKIQFVDRGVPHVSAFLERGMTAVYTFNFQGKFLKIGKVGRSTKSRFTYQHYRVNGASSTLAKSLISDPEMVAAYNLTEENVGEWIKNNCRRIDILIPADLGIFTLNLIEAALHYKYEPKYEGFESQRKYN